MINLLPQSQKRALKREYRSRLMSVGLFLLLMVVLAAIVLLVPSWILTDAKQRAIELEQERLAANQNLQTHNELLQTLRAMDEQLVTFAPPPEDTSYILSEDVVQAIVSLPMPGIRLDQILFKKAGVIPKLELRGSATSRESLLDLQNELNQLDVFMSVDVPVDNFVEQTQLPFIIRATIIHEEVVLEEGARGQAPSRDEL